MKKKNNEFRVFFSWQSDSPKKTNSNAIRNALKVVEKELKLVFSDLEIVIDEATRDTSGSPNIAKTIFNKIDKANMVISDITTINPGEKRPCPNPNVTYELGYAMAILGEDRVVMLFNKAYGNFPNDLPFDFIQNRASPYELNELGLTVAKKNLAELLHIAIKAVIDKNPKTPSQLRGLSREESEHIHDVENIKWLFSNIHMPTLDEYIAELPRVLTTKSMWFWEGFNGVVQNSRFSLYDKFLSQEVRKLHHAWQTSLSFDNCYHDAPGGERHIFSNPGDGVLSPAKQKAWDTIEHARVQMTQAYAAILDHVRTNYIEVKVNKRSDRAWRDYMVDIHKDREFFEPVNSTLKNGLKKNKTVKKGEVKKSKNKPR